MRQTNESTAAHRVATLSRGRIVAIAVSASACLAVWTASQTYVTMLSHHHSFMRLVLWQLGCWGFWAVAAPWIVRRAASSPMRHLVGIGFGLAVVHALVVAVLARWLQPFVPVIAYDFRTAVTDLCWFFALLDPLVVGLLIVCGRGLAAYERAQQLQLWQSQLEAQLVRAQLDALRLEIQPHFLFNTLNSLAALIRSNDNSAALSMLLGLSDVMRDTLDRTDAQVAPLGRELEIIRKYVELQRARFGNRVRAVYQVERAAERCDVPVLLLQPLVENALRHGLGPRSTGGEIIVGASLDGPDRLRVWVSDDGVGVPAGFDLSTDAGTGLGNTRARIAHLYGTRAELAVRVAPGGGTVAEIVLPITGPSVVRLVESGAA